MLSVQLPHKDKNFFKLFLYYTIRTSIRFSEHALVSANNKYHINVVTPSEGLVKKYFLNKYLYVCSSISERITIQYDVQPFTFFANIV